MDYHFIQADFFTWPGQKLYIYKMEGQPNSVMKIRPHRFGGEGVLIGVQTATLNASSHLLI